MAEWWQDDALRDLAVHVPCQWACPAGVRVPDYIRALQDGDPARARDINLHDTLLPGVLGRVCTRPCEPACRHGREGLGEAVAICPLKRAAAGQSLDAPWPAPPPPAPANGKSVAVVGGGPAGLMAARTLARAGHAVTLLEARDECGGLPLFAIPAFRLPPEVTRREVAQALPGIALRTGVHLGRDVTLADLRAAHDAVVLATGCPVPRAVDVPGRDLPGVHGGLTFLLAANAGAPAPVGLKVVVLGGGFTAVDCARTARRLGAEDVTIAYRRERQDARWREEERLDLLAEGIALRECLAPAAFEGDGRVQAARFTRTRVEVDPATGARVARHRPGEEVVLPADTVLVALGQIAERGPADDATLSDRDSGRTALTGVFATGDLALGTATVVEAVGHGRRVAEAVDAFLSGRPAPRLRLVERPCGNTTRPLEWNDLPRVETPGLPVAARLARPDAEADPGLSVPEADDEAKRCYLCDLTFRITVPDCIFCDKCVEACPVRCIHYTWAGQWEDASGGGLLKRLFRAGKRGIVIDQDPCIRCGVCADICPVSCIPVTRLQFDAPLPGDMPP